MMDDGLVATPVAPCFASAQSNGSLFIWACPTPSCIRRQRSAALFSAANRIWTLCQYASRWPSFFFFIIHVPALRIGAPSTYHKLRMTRLLEINHDTCPRRVHVCRVMVMCMSGYFWVRIESRVALGWCVPPGWHAMVETDSSWSCGVHGADLHGRSRIVRMSKWLTVLLRGSCKSWRDGRHGSELHGLFVAPVLLCIQLPSPMNM